MSTLNCSSAAHVGLLENSENSEKTAAYKLDVRILCNLKRLKFKLDAYLGKNSTHCLAYGP